MEKKAAALQKLLTDYGTEFRTQFVLAALLPVAALWVAIALKVAETPKDHSSVVHIVLITEGLAAFVILFGHLYYRRIQRLHSVAFLVSMVSKEKKVTFIRHLDFKRVEKIQLSVSSERFLWSIYEIREGMHLGDILYREVELSALQAHAAQGILNE